MPGNRTVHYVANGAVRYAGELLDPVKYPWLVYQPVWYFASATLKRIDIIGIGRGKKR